jgi:hypothetical protein
LWLAVVIVIHHEREKEQPAINPDVRHAFWSRSLLAQRKIIQTNSILINNFIHFFLENPKIEFPNLKTEN